MSTLFLLVCSDRQSSLPVDMNRSVQLIKPAAESASDPMSVSMPSLNAAPTPAARPTPKPRPSVRQPTAAVSSPKPKPRNRNIPPVKADQVKGERVMFPQNCFACSLSPSLLSYIPTGQPI